MSQFRTRAIYVSNNVHEGLSVLAEILGHTCADETADIELGKLLETHHQLDWLKGRTKRDRETRLQEYKERIQKDELP